MKNSYRVIGDIVEIDFKYKGKSYVTLISTEDLNKVQVTGTWHGFKAGNHVYLRARNKGKLVQMHRLILEGEIIDHRDRDTFNNTRSNLRATNRSMNARNVSAPSSGIRGVYFHKKNKNWIARIQLPHKRVQLGTFQCPYEAGRAYTRACLEHFGTESVTRVPIVLNAPN